MIHRGFKGVILWGFGFRILVQAYVHIYIHSSSEGLRDTRDFKI